MKGCHGKFQANVHIHQRGGNGGTLPLGVAAPLRGITLQRKRILSNQHLIYGKYIGFSYTNGLWTKEEGMQL